MPETIDVAKIKPNPRQPRRHFDEGGLQELADSIARHGVLNPVLVRPQGAEYELVHGERRWRAAQRAGLAEVPAEVRDLSDEEVLEIALAENLQREDLTPIEEAEVFQHYLSEGLTQTDLAGRIAKSQSYVAQKLRLLNLHWAIRAWIMSRDITEGHARQLLRLKGICEAITTEAPCSILDSPGGECRQGEWHEYFGIDLAYKTMEQGWTVAHLRDVVDIIEERVVFAALAGNGDYKPDKDSDVQSARDWWAWKPDRAKIKDDNVLAAGRRRLGALTESDEEEPATGPVIDPEFEALLPALTEDELAGLERDILQRGIMIPLNVWAGRNILLDGHARLRIARKHGLSYEVQEVDLPDRDAAIAWIIRNQLARHNLTPQARELLMGMQYNRQKDAD